MCDTALAAKDEVCSMRCKQVTASLMPRPASIKMSVSTMTKATSLHPLALANASHPGAAILQIFPIPPQADEAFRAQFHAFSLLGRRGKCITLTHESDELSNQTLTFGRQSGKF